MTYYIASLGDQLINEKSTTLNHEFYGFSRLFLATILY